MVEPTRGVGSHSSIRAKVHAVATSFMTPRLEFTGANRLFSNCLCFSNMFSPSFLKVSLEGNRLANDRTAEVLANPELRKAHQIEPKPPLEIARSLLSECPDNGAVTLYLDSAPHMVQFGITTIDVARLTPGEMEGVLGEAKARGITPYYHAPWMEKIDERGTVYQPNPEKNPALFDGVQALAKAHQNVYGEKAQITIHITGTPENWKSWVESTSPNARIVIENSFRGPDAETVKLLNITQGFPYFQNSDFHAPQEVIQFAQALGIRDICFDQAHAFAGYRPNGRFEAIGDLLYLEQLMDAGLNIAHFHRAAVRRDLAGRERETLTADQLDQHGPMTPFTREWFLTNYPDEANTINRIFDKLDRMNKQMGGIPVTFEVKPGALGENLSGLQTEF